MATNKKINIPISNLSSNEIYALLDTIDKDDEEDIENLMNDSDTEFVDPSLVEKKDVHEDMQPKKSTNGEHSNHISTKLSTEAVVRQAIPEEESDNDKPLSKLVKQKEPVWKWRKRFVETPLQPCSLNEEGVVNIQVENTTPYDVFTKCIGLPGLLSMIKMESERHAAQNGREFNISEE